MNALAFCASDQGPALTSDKRVDEAFVPLAAVHDAVLRAGNTIEDYLNEINQAYRSDSSNIESRFARNYIRNELIPNLKRRFGDSVPEAIARLGSQAAETEAYLAEQAIQLRDAIVSQSESHVELDCTRLVDVSPVLIRQLVSQIWTQLNWPRQAMTYHWFQKITEVVQDQQDSTTRVVLNLPGSVELERKDHRIRFSK